LLYVMVVDVIRGIAVSVFYFGRVKREIVSAWALPRSSSALLCSALSGSGQFLVHLVSFHLCLGSIPITPVGAKLETAGCVFIL
jgi:hypothetical protein